MTLAAALTVHAADPAGTAGTAVDLAVFGALGVRGVSITTGVASRTELSPGVLHELPAAAVRAQLAALAHAAPVAAAKTGFLGPTPVVRLLARELRRRGAPVVVDPVLPARREHRPAGASWSAIVRELLPAAVLVTPNLPEASLLAGFPIRDEADAKRAARAIQAHGPHAVLIKGGHAEGAAVVDGLLDGRTWRSFRTPRLGPRVPGSGDALSAAVTALLARGETLPDAVERALAFVHRAIADARSSGPDRLLLPPSRVRM